MDAVELRTQLPSGVVAVSEIPKRYAQMHGTADQMKANCFFCALVLVGKYSERI